NCPVPNGVSGLSAIRNIREAALKFGPIDQFEAYCDWSNKSGSNIKNDLSISGVKLRDCPKKGWIGTVDKAIVVDMMVYALERPRMTTVLLISGDKDHAYAISTLRNRGYPVKLVAPTGTLHSGLQVFADLLDWNSIFRSDPPPTELVDLSGLAGGEGEETEEEEETSEDEGEDVGEDEDEDAKGEEERTETEEKTQVQVGVEAEADKTGQGQVGVETVVEEIARFQVEAKEKAQVLVETDEEADSEEPASATQPNVPITSTTSGTYLKTDPKVAIAVSRSPVANAPESAAMETMQARIKCPGVSDVPERLRDMLDAAVQAGKPRGWPQESIGYHLHRRDFKKWKDTEKVTAALEESVQLGLLVKSIGTSHKNKNVKTYYAVEDGLKKSWLSKFQGV
ncbi:hypothetical protein FRC05_005690, partial [Tulasnella sp. 425]